MFNVTVLKMSDIVKVVFGFLITVCFIIFISKNFLVKRDNLKKEEMKITTDKIQLGSMKQSLTKTMPIIADLNEEHNNEEDKKRIISGDFLEEFLRTEISSIKGIENIEKKNKSATDIQDAIATEQSDDGNIVLANTENTNTEVVTQNPITDNANVQYKNIKIKNQTSYQLTEEMLNPDITIENKNILIFHTHTCESYTPSEKYQYTQTGNFRTTDLNFSVARVGAELENYLKKYNLNVFHDITYHDYPSYNGSYTNSLATVENILKDNPTDIIIDLHRDAIGSRPDYAPTVKIDDEEAAQIMFVIGTNEGGLFHPNWNENLKFAIKVQEKAEEMYPGLFKSIMLTKSRYNQHTGKYASIIEVGSTGNTLDQCLVSMKYLSAVLNEVINQ